MYVIDSKNIKKYLLTIIILVGVFLRIYRYGDFMAFYADSGRDILIAKHMVEFDGFKFVRPFAYGGNGSIENTPVYYWMLAGFWFFIRSGSGVGIVVAIITSITIYLGYLIGKELKDDRTGMLCALLISISSLMVTYSRSVWQPYMIPLFTSFGLLWLMRLERTKQARYMVGVIGISFIALHIHLSFFPVFLIWMAILADQFMYIKSKLSIRIGIVALFVLGVMQWVIMTDLAKKFVTDAQQRTPFALFEFSQFQYIFLRIVQSFSELAARPNNLGVQICLVIMFIGLAIALVREKSSSRNLSIIIATLGSILFVGFYHAPENNALLEPRYYAPYFVLYLIILSYLIAHFYRIRVVYSLLILFAVFVLGRENMRYVGNPGFDSFVVMKSISTAIYTDIQVHHTDVRDVQILNKHQWSSQYDWFTGPYWYFMEKFYNTKLIQITPEGNNMQMLTRPNIVYLVCVIDNEDQLVPMCLQPFFGTYTNIDPDTDTTIYTNDFDLRYEVHRFMLKL